MSEWVRIPEFSWNILQCTLHGLMYMDTLGHKIVCLLDNSKWANEVKVGFSDGEKDDPWPPSPSGSICWYSAWRFCLLFSFDMDVEVADLFHWGSGGILRLDDQSFSWPTPTVGHLSLWTTRLRCPLPPPGAFLFFGHFYFPGLSFSEPDSKTFIKFCGHEHWSSLLTLGSVTYSVLCVAAIFYKWEIQIEPSTCVLEVNYFH